jgi:hypothetical protein
MQSIPAWAMARGRWHPRHGLRQRRDAASCAAMDTALIEVKPRRAPGVHLQLIHVIVQSQTRVAC